MTVASSRASIGVAEGFVVGTELASRGLGDRRLRGGRESRGASRVRFLARGVANTFDEWGLAACLSRDTTVLVQLMNLRGGMKGKDATSVKINERGIN